MRACDIITKKRGIFIHDEKGKRTLKGDTFLTKEEIDFMIEGYCDHSIPEYQISAWLMAIYFSSMTFEETGLLTQAMLNSGNTIELHGYEDKGLIGPFVDKHSTGGVGDKISLPLAPIVASLGVQVPMMSGRALGHTGGTLDKLESIKGYRVNLSPDEFRELISINNYAMTSQTEEIVPADKLLYALRDVTGTVESIPLITASILSKKVAEGSDALVFDVKCGSGAFMKTLNDATMLAESLVKTSKSMGKKATAIITNMDTPLGRKIGNFLEIEETIECLQGKGPEDVMKETYVLASRMLLLAGKCSTQEEGLSMVKCQIANGEALKYFLKNIKDQGGNPDKLMEEVGNRRSPFTTQIVARCDGYITIDAYTVGMAGIILGVGRNKTTDQVCADAGIILKKIQGDKVKQGDVIMEVYGKDNNCLSPSKELLNKAITYNNEPVEKKPLIYKLIE